MSDVSEDWHRVKCSTGSESGDGSSCDDWHRPVDDHSPQLQLDADAGHVGIVIPSRLPVIQGRHYPCNKLHTMLCRPAEFETSLHSSADAAALAGISKPRFYVNLTANAMGSLWAYQKYIGGVLSSVFQWCRTSSTPQRLLDPVLWMRAIRYDSTPAKKLKVTSSSELAELGLQFREEDVIKDAKVVVYASEWRLVVREIINRRPRFLFMHGGWPSTATLAYRIPRVLGRSIRRQASFSYRYGRLQGTRAAP